jgi:hypothetical protein
MMTLEADPIARTEHLESVIQKRSGRQVHDLRVAFVEGGLILRGQARTFYAKQLAQHAAMEITGLLVQANEIEVE